MFSFLMIFTLQTNGSKHERGQAGSPRESASSFSFLRCFSHPRPPIRPYRTRLPASAHRTPSLCPTQPPYMPLSPSSIEHTSAAPPQPSSTSSFSTPAHHDALHSLDSHEPDELPQADLRNGRGPKGRAAKGRGQTLKLDWGTPQRRAQHDDDGQASDATDEDDLTSEDTADKEQTS